jgi:hypothetical protein
MTEDEKTEEHTESSYSPLPRVLLYSPSSPSHVPGAIFLLHKKHPPFARKIYSKEFTSKCCIEKMRPGVSYTFHDGPIWQSPIYFDYFPYRVHGKATDNALRSLKPSVWALNQLKLGAKKKKKSSVNLAVVHKRWNSQKDRNRGG